jgi:hypothetical protein
MMNRVSMRTLSQGITLTGRVRISMAAHLAALIVAIVPIFAADRSSRSVVGGLTAGGVQG